VLYVNPAVADRLAPSVISLYGGAVGISRELEANGQRDEAAMIATEILHREYTSKARWGDFAVLYRGNHQSRVLEQALRDAPGASGAP